MAPNTVCVANANRALPGTCACLDPCKVYNPVNFNNPCAATDLCGAGAECTALPGGGAECAPAEPVEVAGAALELAPAQY